MDSSERIVGQAAGCVRCLIACIFLGAVDLLIPEVSPQEPDAPVEVDTDDLLDEFNDSPSIEFASPPEEPKASDRWAIDGFFRTDMSYSIAHGSPEPGQPDYRDFSKLRTTLQLEVPVKISDSWNAYVSGQAFHDFSYGLKDRENFSRAVLDVYENQAEIREAYLRGSPWPQLDLKVGRQIVVWGGADYIRVVDVLNPLDNREPGLVDLEDLRLPVTMSRLDYSMDRWTLTGVAIHEMDFGKNPVFNSQFYPGNVAAPPESVPSNTLENTEFGFSVAGTFPGWDLGLYYANYFDDTPHFESRGRIPGLLHSRLSMVGASVNGVVGSWVWKAETAVVNGLEFDNLPSERLCRLDGLAGLEYSGIRNTKLGLEVVNRRLLDYEPALDLAPDFADENVTQYTFSYLSSFLRDRLHMVALCSFFGAGFDRGGFQRLSAAYDFFDGFSVTGGVLIFQGGENGGVPAAYEANDLLFLQAKYSF